VLWKELGRYVIAFTRGEALLHFTPLSARRLDAAAAQEIRSLCLGLEVQGFLTRPTGLRVWTTTEPDFSEAMKDALGVRMRVEPKPDPVLPMYPSGIFPPEMARAARDRAQRRRKARLIFALAAVYVLGFAAWAGWLFWRDQDLSRQTAELERRRPQVEAVRQMQTRWQVLEPATNADTYPTELFHRVVSLLPNEGIQLKEFFMESDKLVISGKASTIGHEKKFETDIRNDPGLHQYSWNFPQPTILEDNQASFRAEGTLKPGGESQTETARHDESSLRPGMHRVDLLRPEDVIPPNPSVVESRKLVDSGKAGSMDRSVTSQSSFRAKASPAPEANESHERQ
jgi:hypothetical protein